jgi:hypothetical protein
MMKAEHRARSRVEELGVNDLVDELLARGVTYEQIASHVREERGVDIGKSSIARYNDRVRRRLAETAKIKEAAEAIATQFKRVGDQPDTDLAETVLNVVQCTLLDRLSGGDELEIKDVVGLSMAAAKTAQARSSIERLQSTEKSRLDRAYAKVYDRLRSVLEGNGIWPEVERVLVEMRGEIVPS